MCSHKSYACCLSLSGDPPGQTLAWGTDLFTMLASQSKGNELQERGTLFLLAKYLQY